MEFAHKELCKRGWKDGKGLGKSEDGIATALKCKIKLDQGGLGHDPGEQFTYNWWDHVFKKALDRVNVEENEGEVQVVSSKSQQTKTVISSSRSSSVRLARRGLVFGRFVKASDPAKKDASSDESDEEESSKNLGDDELLRVCGGRTANRAARHGLGLNGKLERIRQQEEAFVAGMSAAADTYFLAEGDVLECCGDCGAQIRKRKYREAGRCRSCLKSRAKSSEESSSPQEEERITDDAGESSKQTCSACGKLRRPSKLSSGLCRRCRTESPAEQSEQEGKGPPRKRSKITNITEAVEDGHEKKHKLKKSKKQRQVK